MAKDIATGDLTEKIHETAVKLAVDVFHLPEDRVDLGARCLEFGFSLIASTGPHMVKSAKKVVDATKKHLPKSALNPNKLSKQGKQAVEKTQAEQAKKLLPGEGKVGTYGELKKFEKPGDNLSAHHIPHDNYMRTRGIKKNDGISMMIEDPYPGVGGRHREIHKTLKKQNPNKGPRDALAEGVKVTKDVYKKDGVYTPEVRQSIQKVVEENKKLHPHLFKKGPS